VSSHGELYDRIEKTVGKLHVLKDSCAGILHTDKESSNLIWFQGAGAMLREAVDEMQKTLHAIGR
jgi:hypothetical protein